MEDTDLLGAFAQDARCRNVASLVLRFKSGRIIALRASYIWFEFLPALSSRSLCVSLVDVPDSRFVVSSSQCSIAPRPG